MLNQYYNIDNLNAHYYGIARELYSELEGKISHLVMAVGTFGTAVGVGKHFKERGSKIKIIGVDSAASFRSNNGIQLQTNLEGIGVPHDAPLYSSDFIDEIYTVSDEEAILMLKKLAHQQGLLVGPASGATAYIASKLLEEREDVTSVGIICTDSGRAYLSKNFYSSDSISASSSSSVASSSSSAEIKLDSLVE
jgi:cysteine synthase